jgi:hypothetical protein
MLAVAGKRLNVVTDGVAAMGGYVWCECLEDMSVASLATEWELTNLDFVLDSSQEVGREFGYRQALKGASQVRDWCVRDAVDEFYETLCFDTNLKSRDAVEEVEDRRFGRTIVKRFHNSYGSEV